MLSSFSLSKTIDFLRREPHGGDTTPDLYRGVVRQLTSSTTSGRGRAIGISSASLGEGVTTVAGQLAISASRLTESRVLLVDCNLQHSEVESAFGLPSAAGLRDVLGGRKQLSDCIRRTRVANLAVLGPGSRMRGSDQAQWKQLLDTMTAQSSLVVFDMPPASELVSQSAPLSMLDGMLLVIAAERSRRPAVQRAVSQLTRTGVTIDGAILNMRKTHVPNWLYNRI